MPSPASPTPRNSIPGEWRSQQNFLLVAAFIMPLTFSVWQALLNNFVIERAAFTGAEIGILQSLREIPGFLAFTAVFVLLIIREQRFALASLLVMSAGCGADPLLPDGVRPVRHHGADVTGVPLL